MTDEQISELWQQAWNSMPDVARKPPTIPPVAIAFARALLDSSHLTEAVEQTVPGEELIRVARLIEDMKQECGMDPESPVAIRNSRLMSIAWILRNLAARHGADPDRLTPNEESPASPAGFVLVPVEPTPQMHAAFAFSYDPPQYPGGHQRLDFRSAYRAMLAAAPTVEAKP